MSTEEKLTANATISVAGVTQYNRFVIVIVLTLGLATIVDLKIALLWGAISVIVGLVRANLEKERAQETQSSSPKVKNKRVLAYIKNDNLYLLIAFLSGSHLSLAALLGFYSDAAYALAFSMTYLVCGLFMVVVHFKGHKKYLVCVSAPYILTYFWIIANIITTQNGLVILACAIVSVVTMVYALQFSVSVESVIKSHELEREQFIADLERARMKAEHASDAKTMFLANMSHEIRTPMNGVLGMAELLTQSRLDNRQRIFAETIYKSGLSLLTIINDILDFSKIEAGKLELDNSTFDLVDSVEDVAALVASNAQEKQLEMVVRFQPGLPTIVIGDGGRIRQVITILVSNAVKFTNEGHVFINVCGTQTDDIVNLRLEVKDTGIGIDESKLNGIFKAFQQADTTTTREFGGTGLGLSISQSLIAAMGGKIGVNSTKGEGSTFWIELDLPMSDEVSVELDMQFDAAGRKILVVDDNEVNRQILEEQLRAWGFTPSLASSAEQSLLMLERAAQEDDIYDLAILDYQMPHLDGEELAIIIRADSRYSDLQLMALTSVDRPGSAKAFTKIGVQGYLVKPARSVLLFETIVSILNKKDGKQKLPTSKDLAQIASLHQETKPLVMDKVKILLAEDNVVNQLVVRHMLDPNRYELVIAENGKEAVATYVKDPEVYNMILMDVSMPVMDGNSAAKAIRTYENENGLEAIPIVCLTAHVMVSDIELSREAGMDDYLTKPVAKDKLDVAITKWGRKPTQSAKNASA